MAVDHHAVERIGAPAYNHVCAVAPARAQDAIDLDTAQARCALACGLGWADTFGLAVDDVLQHRKWPGAADIRCFNLFSNDVNRHRCMGVESGITIRESTSTCR